MRDFWQDDAACKGMPAEVFYPDVQEERGVDTTEAFAEAKAICEACPVRETCQAESIANREPDGVWGGLTPLERRRVIRKLTKSPDPRRSHHAY